MKKVELRRIARKATYTIGRLSVDGRYICDTIEDRDRGISQDDTLEDIKRVKVKSQTAIPTGTYRVVTNVVSPKFSQKAYYKQYCGGRLPRLLNVPGFDGILIHRGVDENSSAGCIIVGYNKVVGKVVNSQAAFEKLYPLLSGDDRVYITIK